MRKPSVDTTVREGDVIYCAIHVDKAVSLRVALQPCPCRAVKSNATTEVRASFDRSLARAIAGPSQQ